MISVIVVNWNGREHLDVCLDALRGQIVDQHEIILVDNGSTDGSTDYVVERYTDVRAISLPRNLGFCIGNNVGIQASEGEFVALINNDTEADATWLQESVGALRRHPEAGFTASRIRWFDHRNYLDTAGDLYFRTGYPGKRGWLLPDGPCYDQEKWVFGACAGAAVYRRAMLDEIGLLDEDFFAYMEDIDLSFRAQLAGYKCLYVPSAVVYHKVGATAGRKSSRVRYWSHRNHWYALIKNLPSELWSAYVGQILMAETLVLVSAIQRHQVGVFAHARKDVVRSMSAMLRKRKVVQESRRVSVDYIDALIRKDWIAWQRATRIREQQRWAS